MKKKLIIFFSIWLLLTLSAISSFYFRNIFTSNVDYKNEQVEISNRFIKEVINLESELIRAEEHLQAGDIKNFKSNSCIFYLENGRLKRWTEYRMPFEIQFLNGFEKWKKVKTEHGLFLVYKKDFLSATSVKQLVGVLPIFRDYKLNSDFLDVGYNPLFFKDLEVKEVETSPCVVLKWEKLEIGKYNLKYSDKNRHWTSVLFMVITFAAIISSFILIHFIYIFLRKRKYEKWGLILLFIALIKLRLLVLYFGFPGDYVDFKLFSPHLFASSWFRPSLGDLFLNLVFANFFLLYFISYLSRNQWFIKIGHQLRFPIILIVALIFGGVNLYQIESLLRDIYFNSQLNFDLTESLKFGIGNIFYVLIFSLLVLQFFLINHSILKITEKLTKHSKNLKQIFFISLPLIAIILATIFYFHFIPFIVIPLLWSLYLWTCLKFMLHKDLRSFQYKTYIYLTFGSIICALTASFGILENAYLSDKIQKERFADHLILYNDIQGEAMMSDLSKYIVRDSLIIKNLTNPYVPKEMIEEIAIGKYLSNYFDKYDIHFSYFNTAGQPYYKNVLQGKLSDLEVLYKKFEFETLVGDLYFVTNYKKDFLSIYYQFITISNSNNEVLGTIVIDYTLKQYIAKSILPSLLQLGGIEGYKNIEKFDYAILTENKLQFSMGNFNYNHLNFLTRIGDSENNYFTLNYSGYDHFVIKGDKDSKKTIVVSSKIDFWRKIISNFSYHFLLLVFIALFILIFNSLNHYRKKRNSDYSTRIQSYLNLSTFIPLILLSLFILGLMTSLYQKDQQNQYKNTAEVLSSHVLDYLEDYGNNQMGVFEFKNHIDRLSKYSGTDINIYDTEGRLVMSNQPLLFESGVLSNLMNPKAAKEILEMKHRLVQMEEKIGDFVYNNVYVALSTPEDSEIKGVLSIPFFDSTQQIEQKRISAVTIIINVFATVFILLLVASYFITQSLTSPLRLIASKLRNVETGAKNEAISWESNDELGLLISEYNQMLLKIEESKLLVAKNEKEMAWKEMAQQVAHEIKNPLTPMKLKLQHLKRVMEVKDEKTHTTIDSLLETIETLSDIATSFSAFAKMPLPENERIDLSEVCEHSISLYLENDSYELDYDIEKEIFINGDAKLLGRILSNLILNAIQSIPSDKKGIIQLKLYKKEMKAFISISDNGSGIPDEISGKVFVPNFTTKYAGSGIGLAVAKNGIEQMGGKIWFETTENIGTTFFIELICCK